MFYVLIFLSAARYSYKSVPFYYTNYSVKAKEDGGVLLTTEWKYENTQAVWISNIQFLFPHFLEIIKYIPLVKNEEICGKMNIDPHFIQKLSSGSVA